MNDKKLTIWFISKYGGTPGNGNYLRNFYFCKEFVKNNNSVSFFNSYNQINCTREKLKSYFVLHVINGVKNYQINGPRINQGFSYKRIYSWFVFEYNLLRLIFTKIRNERPDVIIVKSISLFSIVSGLFLKFKYKTKLVLEITDIWPKTIIDIGNYSVYNPFILLLGLIEKIGYRFSDAIVGSMPNLRQHIKEVLNYEKEVFYIPQGYSKLDECGSSENILKWSDSTVFSIIYAGTLGSANKIDDLISVARILHSRQVKCHFFFLGDGPLKSYYIKESATMNNVSFLDAISRESVSSFLSNFDLLTIAWKKSELYKYGISPNKVMDYMKSGRPILMSYSGFPSLFESDKYCFIVEAENVDLIADKIEEIMKMQSETLDEMGRNAMRILEKYHSYNVLALKYLNILNKIV